MNEQRLQWGEELVDGDLETVVGGKNALLGAQAVIGATERAYEKARSSVTDFWGNFMNSMDEEVPRTTTPPRRGPQYSHKTGQRIR